MTIKFRKTALLLVVLASFAGLSACGKKDGNAPATQVAAKVGSEELSVHQINQVLSRTNTAGAAPEAVQAMSREVLEKLIDQQLAVSKAVDTKLDRSPETVAAIEAARREILARAYLQKVAGALPKPSAEESQKYYAEHPQLFSQRRIFNIQEILVPTSPGLAEQLRGMAASGKSIEEVAALLKAKDLKFNGGSASRPAEQIPLELLTKVHALKDGQSMVLEAPQAITYLRLASSQSAPIDQATALPRIDQFLTNQRASEAIAADMKQLRASTTITYMGEFAKPVAAAAAVVSPVEAKTEKSVTNPPVVPVDKAQSAIEKGVAGLK
jgi:EpsD family peptidyl-prolyl cis-trans isomerase